jgi:hypothetical protein
VRDAHVEEVELARRHRLPLLRPLVGRERIANERVFEHVEELADGSRRHLCVVSDAREVELLAVGQRGNGEEPREGLDRPRERFGPDLLGEIDADVLSQVVPRSR